MPSFEDNQTKLEKDEQKRGYKLHTLWRARYNLCVHDARNREDTLKTLRFSAPEVYCLEYASAFVPQRATVPPHRGRPDNEGGRNERDRKSKSR